ncbi:hypothetical protein CP980_34375 [Streptomyces vinaceus]|uniref:Uncharacterized protein n=1 Tax=Streptomyces vinaceus TaxID=1960 RepID=A0A5J6JEU3_STRVI|nr:hypothetical protein CP980_34375 [Streptomyces vinaceus]
MVCRRVPVIVVLHRMRCTRSGRVSPGGDIIAFYTLSPADGSPSSTSQEAIVRYSRQQPGGVCGPDN